MNFWLITYRSLCVALVLILITGVIAVFLPKIRENTEKHRRIQEMEEANRIQEDAMNKLRLKHERFLSDPRYVEQIAREELGKSRPGETIFRFQETSTNTIAQPQ